MEVWLGLDQFTAGSLADAQPLTLLMPRTKYEEPFIIGQMDGRRVAVFVGENHRFENFTCDGADRWKGLLIPGIAIEVALSSVFDPETNYVPKGAILRRGTELLMASQGKDSHGFPSQNLIALATGLEPALTESAFLKWHLVIGRGDEKRALLEIKVEPTNNPY